MIADGIVFMTRLGNIKHTLKNVIDHNSQVVNIILLSKYSFWVLNYWLYLTIGDASNNELKIRFDEQSFTCKFTYYCYRFLSMGVRFLCRLKRCVLINWLNYFYRGPTRQSYKRGGADAWWELGAKAINLQFTEVARDISGPFR